MAVICPTVTAYNADEYKRQLERLLPFAKRIHLDFMDGLFADVKSVDLEEAWLPKLPQLEWDLHLMFIRPDLYIDQASRFRPGLIITHAEASGNFTDIADAIRKAGSKVGVALLQKTPVKAIFPAIGEIDHVLIFSGNLGRQYGSQVDFSLLDKVKELKDKKPEIEIAWDGGVNDDNAERLVQAGVDVLDVGGYVQRSNDPAAAYAKLVKTARKSD